MKGPRERILKASSVEEAARLLATAKLDEASAKTIRRCQLAYERRQKGPWAPPKPKAVQPAK